MKQTLIRNAAFCSNLIVSLLIWACPTCSNMIEDVKGFNRCFFSKNFTFFAPEKRHAAKDRHLQQVAASFPVAAVTSYWPGVFSYYGGSYMSWEVCRKSLNNFLWYSNLQHFSAAFCSNLRIWACCTLSDSKQVVIGHYNFKFHVSRWTLHFEKTLMIVKVAAACSKG